MKQVLISLVLMVSISAMSQRKADSVLTRQASPRNSNNDSAAQPTKKDDTMRLALKDSSLVAAPAAVDSLRILIVKDEEAAESIFYKYWFPALMILAGAVFGAALTLWAEYIRRWFNIRKAGRRWIGLAKIYIPIIKKQENLIDEYLANEDPHRYSMTALNRVSFIDGEQFSAYSSEDLLSYLETHKKNTAADALRNVTKLTATLSSLKLTYQQLDNSYKLYETAISRHSIEATQLLRNIGAALADWTRAIDQRGFYQGEQAHYYAATQLYQDQVLNMKQTDNWDIFQLDANFYTPMIDVLEPIYTSDEVYKVLKSIEVAKYAIPQVKAEKGYMMSNARTLLARYNEYRTELAETIEEIENSEKTNKM